MKFSGGEFLETAPKFTKRKKNLSSVSVLHETCHQEISRPSRAVTAKKCTKKCNARAELLFWLQNLLLFDVLVAVAVALLNSLLGSLSNDDGSGNENVAWKYNMSFVLLRDYFNSLNFYRNGELSRNRISRSGVQVKKEYAKFTVVRSRSPQNLNCGHFTLLFCRGRQRNVPKCKRTCRAIVFAH